MFAANVDIKASGAYVTFEPGARSAWHTHPAGQRLVVVSGVGLTQEWGKPVQEIRPGDVVWCPPGVKHWHGAPPTTAMAHLAVTGAVDGKSVEWLEKVTDDQYSSHAAGSDAGPQAMTDAQPASETLSAKQQAIPLIAAFAATSDMPGLNATLNQGLDAGLTISEAKEILVHLYAYTGFPRSLNALGELMKVVEERRTRGIEDAPGREPSRPAPTGDALLVAGTANQTRIAGAPVKGPLFDFAPVINQYLQSHLFGDIFERDNLDWQSRELATVGALAAMPGVEPQLRSHMAASTRVGLTTSQLRQLTRVLAERGEADAARRAREALDSHPAEAPGQGRSSRRNAEATPSERSGPRNPDEAPKAAPLMVEDQGSFAVGGGVVRNPGAYKPLKPSPEGQTLHGDHARVFYQVPVNPRELPLVMWHGFGQFSRTWESTPDGREGYQNIFLRRRFPVYLVDQPRRGGAGRGTVGATINATPDDQRWFDTFRLGTWPELFPGVQFSKSPEALEQFFRQAVPDTGPFDAKVATDAVSALFDKIGPGVLVTHSHSGGLGWRAAMGNPRVRAVVSYEPGSGFVFPEGETPPPMPSATGPLEAVDVPLPEFMALTRIPIVIYYGDNIPAEPTEKPGQDNWRVRLAMAKLWAEAVNRKGGDATVVHLPEVGIRGNTHFPFSDLNNVEVADLMSGFLAEKGLDGDSSVATKPDSRPTVRETPGSP
nr:carboxymuconolactone decarboxylase family protein [Singulisphaera acidiphila]